MQRKTPAFSEYHERCVWYSVRLNYLLILLKYNTEIVKTYNKLMTDYKFNSSNVILRLSVFISVLEAPNRGCSGATSVVAHAINFFLISQYVSKILVFIVQTRTFIIVQNAKHLLPKILVLKLANQFFLKFPFGLHIAN